MDAQQKQIKQLEAQVAKLEKAVNLLLNRTHQLDVEVRRLKGNHLQTKHQIAAVERNLHRGE